MKGMYLEEGSCVGRFGFLNGRGKRREGQEGRERGNGRVVNKINSSHLQACAM